MEESQRRKRINRIDTKYISSEPPNKEKKNPPKAKG